MIKKKLALFFLCFIIVDCASRQIMNYEKIEEFQMNKEYEEMVKVKKTVEPPSQEEKILTVKPAKPSEKKAHLVKKPSVTPKPKEKKKERVVVKPVKRQPELEDSEGFIQRRPLKDPFNIGEEIEMAVTYFNMAAGYLTFKVHPLVTVNERKSYDFEIAVKSSNVFSYFYKVDDKARTFVDYEDLVPSSYTIDVKETNQLKDIRSFFNFDKSKAVYWEKKIKKGKAEENKKKEWDILDYSQNVISAFFYLRTFQLTPGKNLAFRVADSGKNLIFRGEVLRKEKLETDLGSMNTVVVKPKIEIDGVFKQVGDIYFWLTDDEHKFPVRIDAKIKIGTLVLKVKSIKK